MAPDFGPFCRALSLLGLGFDLGENFRRRVQTLSVVERSFGANQFAPDGLNRRLQIGGQDLGMGTPILAQSGKAFLRGRHQFRQVRDALLKLVRPGSHRAWPIRAAMVMPAIRLAENAIVVNGWLTHFGF